MILAAAEPREENMKADTLSCIPRVAVLFQLWLVLARFSRRISDRI